MSFRDYLRDLGLSENTIRVYSSTVRGLGKRLEKGKGVDEGLRKYLHKRIIRGRSYYTRYAIKHYLKYKNMPETVFMSLPKPKLGDSEVEVATYVDRNKIKQILWHLKKWPEKKYYVIAVIQAYCGTRPSETIKLNKKNFRMGDDNILTITVYGKGRKTRKTLIYPPMSTEVVHKYISNKGQYPFIFQTIKNIESQNALQAVLSVYKTYYLHVKESALAVGIDGFKPHDFRRNFADALLSNGNDIYTVQQALGHSDIKTTLIYLKNDVSRFKEALKDLY